MKARWPIAAGGIAGLLLVAGAVAPLRHRAPAQSVSLPAVAWDTLGNVQPPAPGQTPAQEFDAAALALNGRLVTLAGYMTPFNLGDGATVSSFLLTGTPGTCPFCMGAGPADFVIVMASPAVTIDISNELRLKGRFRVMQNDATGFYYRLDDATAAP